MTDTEYDKKYNNNDYIPEEVLNNLCSQNNQNENLEVETPDQDNKNKNSGIISLEVYENKDKKNNYNEPFIRKENQPEENYKEPCCLCSCECISDCCSHTFSESNMFIYASNLAFWGWLALLVLSYKGIITLPRSHKVFTDFDFSGTSGGNDDYGALILLIFYIIFFFLYQSFLLYIQKYYFSYFIYYIFFIFKGS